MVVMMCMYNRDYLVIMILEVSSFSVRRRGQGSPLSGCILVQICLIQKWRNGGSWKLSSMQNSSR